jgi:hypothetical protein
VARPMEKEHIQPPTCFIIELKSWILKDDKYNNGWLLKNTRHTHFEGENEFKLQDLAFIIKHKQIPSPNQQGKHNAKMCLSWFGHLWLLS